MVIRHIAKEDAQLFIDLRSQLEQETQFMLLEPGEQRTTLTEQEDVIGQVISSDNNAIFVVELENELIGFIGGKGTSWKRNKHCLYVVIGIIQQHTNKGIGKKLFEKLESWALDHNIYRLELTVLVHNEIGISLYKKMGFKIEGTKKHSLKINEQYLDEYYMSKFLKTNFN